MNRATHDQNFPLYDPILRMSDLKTRVRLSPSHIYFLISEGLFPRPFRLVPGGRASGWRLSAVNAWLLDRENDVTTGGRSKTGVKGRAA